MLLLKNATLEWQLQQLQQTLDTERKESERGMRDRDDRIRKLANDCDQLMAELQALADAKRKLDNEISVYRTLLEGGENR